MPTVALLLIALGGLAGCDHVESHESSPLREQLLGTWYEFYDKQIFETNGRGRYYHDEEPCFDFSYTLKGDVLTIKPDWPNQCASVLGAEFRIAFEDGKLKTLHNLTGGIWTRTEEEAIAMHPRKEYGFGIRAAIRNDKGWTLYLRQDTNKTIEVISERRSLAKYEVKDGIAYAISDGRTNPEGHDRILIGRGPLAYRDDDGGKKLTLVTVDPDPPKLHICWIEDVVRAGGTLEVYFSPRASLLVRVRGEAGTYTGYAAIAGHLHRLDRKPDSADPDHLVVRNNDKIFLTQGAHDSCALDVNITDRIGVTAHSVFSPPGLGPSHSDEFIPPTK